MRPPRRILRAAEPAKALSRTGRHPAEGRAPYLESGFLSPRTSCPKSSIRATARQGSERARFSGLSGRSRRSVAVSVQLVPTCGIVPVADAIPATMPASGRLVPLRFGVRLDRFVGDSAGPTIRHKLRSSPAHLLKAVSTLHSAGYSAPPGLDIAADPLLKHFDHNIHRDVAGVIRPGLALLRL